MGRLGTYTDTTAAMITGPQMSYLESLTRQLWDLTGKISGADVSEDRDLALAALPGMTKAAASDRIGSLKNDILPTLRKTASYMVQTVEAPVSASDVIPATDLNKIYVLDGKYYRLYRSGPNANRPGEIYAKRLNGATRSFDYVGYGIAAQITDAHIMTAEQAAQIPFTWCIRCGRDLTVADSKARRMGPVCFKKSTI